MKEKTICFVIIGLNSGGAERVVSTLSNELINDYNVLIITLKRTTPFYKLNPNIKVEYCQEAIQPSLNIIQALKTNYQLYAKVKTLLRKHKVDICFGFITAANIISTLAARRLKIPVVISERNNPIMEDSKLSRIWVILRNLVYPKANILVVQTNEIKSFFSKNIPDKKIRLIPNPINPGFAKNSSLKKENIVLNVGRLSKQKAQHLLIKAFANLNFDNWTLLILGEGDERKNLESLIKKLNMSSKIKLMGKVENVEHFYQTSKVFAFTSIYEGFPNALLEAMHFGLACVSTNCPTGPSEIIQDGKNGYLIPLNSEKILTEKLKSLVTDDSLRKEFGTQAKKTSAKYEVENIVKEWLLIIRKLST